VIVAAGLFAAQPRKELKPGFNLFSPDQDIQMGKEASAEVYRTMPVIQNEELSGYLTRIGQRLAKSKRSGQFPFTFAVINDDSINAFALPGGPMFVHTALITAADNESQLAGVLAHEMSHVALRHGTHEASKKNLIELPAMLGGTLLGPGSLWGSLGQMGINLASGSVLLHFSRAAESEADLNGTRMMNDAGYDPHQMARFFEKLQAQGGAGGESKFANFLSDHPTPGNRVKAVDDEIPFLPRISYRESEPETLARAKTIVAGLPPPPKQPAQGQTGNGPQGAKPDALPQASSLRPSSRLQDYSTNTIALGYPSNWQATQDPTGNTVTFAPAGGIVPDSTGQGQVVYGVVMSIYKPQDSVDLRRDTDVVLNGILQGSPAVRKVSSAQERSVGRQTGLTTQLEGPSLFPGETESDTLVTVARPEGLVYFIFVAPRSEAASAQSAYDAMLRSVR
jgi:hypothetical protein